MDLIKHRLPQEPLPALFITISLGHVAGKIRCGKFVTGRIACMLRPIHSSRLGTPRMRLRDSSTLAAEGCCLDPPS